MYWMIDTDPGVDDAAAIILFLRSHLKVLGITVVYGNTHLESTLLNALRIKDLLNSSVPVYRGAQRPLLEPRQKATEVHGKDGLGDLEWPEVRSIPGERSAVEMIIQNSYRYPGQLRILAIGPLTNLALALALDRSLGERIDKLVIMGGTSRAQGNKSITGEFNFVSDPEAAAIVLQSGIPITLVPWETTLLTMIKVEELALEEFQNPLAQTFIKACQPLLKRIKEVTGMEGYILCDLVAAAVAYKEDLILESRQVYGAIELAGKYGRGMLVLDYSGLEGEKPNLTVCQKVDLQQLITVFKGALSHS